MRRSPPRPTIDAAAGTSAHVLEGWQMTIDIAVLLPCHNEEAAIGRVVAAFSAALPQAKIYVYDNLSTDRTAERAREAGARVYRENRKGKGHVVRSMFSDIDADVYVMADGDGTYDASAAPGMIERLLIGRLDMVIGARDADPAADRVYPPGHATGNMLFSRGVRAIFGEEFTDVFSGYRVMSRRFVKSLPVASQGFEIETEISAHAARVLAHTEEVNTPYGSRDEGSSSNLSTYRDGLRILWTIIKLIEEIRPLLFYGSLAALFTLLALVLGVPVIIDFTTTHLVKRFPTAILAAAIQTIAFLFLIAGIIMRRVSRVQNDARRLTYLQIPHCATRLDDHKPSGAGS
jgi:glycosyltransferase involved in cell wall biosynthesis